MSYLKDLLGDSYKEGMTEDEISSALETLKAGKQTDNSAEVEKLKAQLSKANSEAADYKKQLRSKQSDEETKAAETAENMKKLTEENASLKRNIAISQRQAELISMGYDKKLAESTATAMADGDMDTVMKNQTAFIDAQKKQIEADAMKGTPRPKSGSEQGAGANGMTHNSFRKLSLKERFEFAEKNPDEYKELYEDGTDSKESTENTGGNE
jgi:actin-related protein